MAGKLLTFAAFAYLARVGGPDGFGFVEFAGAVTLCASLIVDQGFSPYGAREIARAPQRTQELVSDIVSARLLLACGAYLAVVVLALLLDRPPIVKQLLLLYGLSLFAMPFLLQWVFQGYDQMRTVAAAQVIRQTVFAAAVFALVHQLTQIWLVAVAELAGACSAAGYCLWIFRRRFGGTIQPRLAFSKRLLREGVPIGLSQMLWAVRMFGATLIVGLVASPEDLGLFASAQRILVALHAFVWLYFFNLLPSLARTWQQGGRAFADIVDASLHGVAWAGSIAVVVWVVIAPAVTVAVYGAAFAPAGSTLQWLAGICVIASLSGHYRFGLIAAGRQNAEMMTALLGAVLAVALIPVGYAHAGPRGVAVALCVAEVAVWGSAWWYSRRVLGLRHHLRLIIGPAVATGLAAGLLIEVLPSSLSIRAALAVVTVAGFAMLFDRTARWRVQQAVALTRRYLWTRIGGCDRSVPAPTADRR